MFGQIQGFFNKTGKKGKRNVCSLRIFNIWPNSGVKSQNSIRKWKKCLLFEKILMFATFRDFVTKQERKVKGMFAVWKHFIVDQIQGFSNKTGKNRGKECLLFEKILMFGKIQGFCNKTGKEGERNVCFWEF